MVLSFSGPLWPCRWAAEQSRGVRLHVVVARCRAALDTLGAASKANGWARTGLVRMGRPRVGWRCDAVSTGGGTPARVQRCSEAAPRLRPYAHEERKGPPSSPIVGL
ncbi:hypothetical protein NDU88_003430 [Pleurodeles waltl]|uniref:Uncharacterized protein n=1 Tax=Pleurodeles waltl TaxID=8319 RepID=A0AAV7UC15_PLEWA|nr:hypothetical protein NDU88_003430 [Pleurodeles waltl]